MSIDIWIIIKKDKSIKIIIASGDMDTMQLIDDKKVQVYTLKKGINDTILYDEEKVLERFGFKPEFLPDYKGLRGDPSDNIIGIKGIGEKTATSLISEFKTIEEIYKQLKITNYELKFKKIGISPRVLELIKSNEEEALFSKTLATIRRDAPIDFKLPEQTFWESADLKKIEQVFAKFEFRSLLARLKTFFNNGSIHPVSDYRATPQEGNNPIELQEASIALWLINSEISNPGLDDILLYAKTSNFKEAYAYIFKKLKENNLEKVDEEAMKVKCVDQKMIALGKNIPMNEAAGEFIGLSRFDQDWAMAYVKIYEEGGVGANDHLPLQGYYYEDVFSLLLRTELTIGMVSTQGKWWREIDTVEDYENL